MDDKTLFYSISGIALGVAIVVAALFLSGCEGAGFSNNGAYANQRQCMRVDHFGHEVWFSVPASRKCP